MQHHTWWAAAMKAAFPAALLVAPLGLAQQQQQRQRQQQRLPIDVRITPLAGVQDMPGAWPAAELDVIPVSLACTGCTCAGGCENRSLENT
jgi:hypothetical protein